MSSASTDRSRAPRAPVPQIRWTLAHSDALWLGAILALAFLLRVFRLDAGLWLDEIDTLVHYVRLPTSELVTTYPSLNHHVLFSLEARAMVSLFGESAWTLRLPALLFGLASIWALWLVARQVTSRWEARLAALLLAVSYHHVWFSQNGRGYTGLLFWALIATYLFLRGKQESSLRHWALYGVAVALGIYTHLSAVFFFAGHGVVYLGLVARRFLIRKQGAPAGPVPYAHLSGIMPLYGFAIGAVLALLLHAPLIPDMIRTFTEVAGPRPAAVIAATAQWKSPLWMILEIGRGLGPVMVAALPVLLAVLGAGIVGMSKRAPVLAAIALVHIPLTLAILLALSLRVWPRYFFVDIGFICLFLVHGAFMVGKTASNLFDRHFNRAVSSLALGGILAAIGIAASLVLLPENYRHPKQDFLGARDFIEANRSADSAVATLGLATMPYAEYYAPDWQSLGTLDALMTLEQSRREIWLVYTFPSVTEVRYKDITDYLAAKFEQVGRFRGTLGDGDVVVFRSRR